MAKPVRRQAPALFQDRFDWLDSPWTALLPFTASQTFRIENYFQDNRYLVRAELPGLDPEKDIEVTVDGRTLTIHAERREEHKSAAHSEFRYGSLTRSVALPAAADVKDVTARYDQGILEVSFPVSAGGPEGRRIAIQTAS